MKILCTIPLDDKTKEKFDSLASIHASSIDFLAIDTLCADDIENYDIILGTPPLSLLSKAKQLKYLHLSMAGSNSYVKKGVLPDGALLTNSTGAFGHAISEHMIGMLFVLYKKLHLYRDNQRENKWQDEGKVASIYGARCLVVGMGDIGSAFAQRAYALGMKVSGIRRTTTEKPDYIESMYHPSELKDIIGAFDVVALALPETADTVKLFDKEMFSAMKKDSVLLNVGRGSAIDTDALYDALQSGKLRGAGIDVTDPEPLPKEHPLWQCKNALITPHVSGFFHLQETYENIVSLAYTNLEKYLEGKEPDNIVDFETGYRKVK